MEVPKPSKKKRKKIKKHKGVMALKKELDFIFSWYIRLKDSVNGKVACYTCGKIFEALEVQAGHYWERNTSPLRYEEGNVKPQCGICNCGVFGSKGKPQEFAAHLVNEYGGDHLNQLEEMKKVQVHWKPYMLQEKIDYYTDRVRGLLDKNIVKISKKLVKYLAGKAEFEKELSC